MKKFVLELLGVKSKVTVKDEKVAIVPAYEISKEEKERIRIKDEIIKAIIEIPFNKWDGNTAELNGQTVEFNKRMGGTTPFFVIGGLELRNTDLIDEFEFKLLDYRIESEKNRAYEKLNNLHKSIFDKN